MAREQDQKGTGRHPHKDTQEPYPHHAGSGNHEQRGSSGSHGQEHRGSGSGSHGSSHSDGSRGQEHRSSGGGRSSGSESSDLKSREYRDKEGNVHHHTRTYEEQHGKDEHGKRGGGDR